MNNAKDDRALYLIEKLLVFGLENDMISKWDITYTRNNLLALFDLDMPYEGEVDRDIPEVATPLLEELLDYAYDKGLIPHNNSTYRDLFDTKIMGTLMPRPSEVIERFNEKKKSEGIKAATDDFYTLCQKSDYIRTSRIAKNIKWGYESSFGNLEITINLTKPEKDPKEIASLKTAPQVGYPKCPLCPENVGYRGRVNHPARQTHRILPLTLDEKRWYFQYSPYVYYNEHCIVLSEKHVPMRISRDTFIRLLEFLDKFPHYFIGSNADLPIVGGSILNHDHFQGGHYTFPMEVADIEYTVKSNRYPNIDMGVVNWPMSALRLQSDSRDDLVDACSHILDTWRKYSDPSVDIIDSTEDKDGNTVYHNTITPIARKNKKEQFEIDLVFRNNRTSDEYPLGIFHPHAPLHHIKKENIGLIEVMGLFILPGRLKDELAAIEDILIGKSNISHELEDESHPLCKHLNWIGELIDKYGTNLSEDKAHKAVAYGVGEKCTQVLKDAGVFKTTREGRDAFNRFLKQCDIDVK